MNVFVLDTNIVSYYLKGREEPIRNIRAALSSGWEVLIAPIAYYEVKRGLMAVNSLKLLKEFDDLCEVFGVGRLDNDILDIAADIYVEQRRAGRTSEDADLFIAAFCIKHEYTLVTHNTKHFETVPGLSLLDWAIS
jgi:tRNA(fMet)-specific endonuclease VapC